MDRLHPPLHRIVPPSGRGRLRAAAPEQALADGLLADELVARLARTRIGATHNQYARSQLRRERLAAYLTSRSAAPILLVGEAAGYRGARVSGLPFTSERQLSGTGPAEATATIVHDVLRELGLEEEVLLWNVVPTHPGTPLANRRPTRAEIAAGVPFARELGRGRRVFAVGRVAHAALGAPYVRHPSHGGAADFRGGLLRLRLGGRHVRRFSV